jgi:isopropylmalate/homocitrate/citramalate synthase
MLALPIILSVHPHNGWGGGIDADSGCRSVEGCLLDNGQRTSNID